MEGRRRRDDVIGEAIGTAVRKAVDGVGRAPYPALAAGGPPVPAPPDDDLDPYALVGVEPDAPWDEIVTAYTLRARAWHPDAPSTPDRSGELLRKLGDAYEELRVRRERPAADGVLQPSPVARRRDRDEEDEPSVDLGAPEHAWWAASPIDPFAPEEPEADPPPAVAEPPTADPYGVLRIPSSATWEEIVASYRKLARWYHPDGLVDPSPADRETCEDMIRRLNAAYAELRVRRGR